MSRSAQKRRRTTKLLATAASILLLAGFVWFVRTMMSAKTQKPGRQVQIVQIIKPPPPPPDQPPPPPPEKVEEPLPKDEPEPTPKDDEPPPLQQLGLDADGAAGSDAFGLAANRGGSDLVGGNGSSAFAWFTGRLKDAVLAKLSSDARIGSKHFSVSVRVWIEPDGHIKEVKLVSSSGSKDLDQHIEAALATLSRLDDSPPLEMPQPVSLRIISRS
ncbi:MAG TPA: TonB family protein [Steroidobacteraceae bacterium]|jgi:protein TonB|nr:TonB family protein [Steroidobacteraceae bacterium]